MLSCTIGRYAIVVARVPVPGDDQNKGKSAFVVVVVACFFCFTYLFVQLLLRLLLHAGM
jgi:hypothetical protein